MYRLQAERGLIATIGTLEIQPAEAGTPTRAEAGTPTRADAGTPMRADARTPAKIT